MQLLQQVSEYIKFWFLLLKFFKYTLLSENLITCQAEIFSTRYLICERQPAGSSSRGLTDCSFGKETELRKAWFSLHNKDHRNYTG